MTTTEHQRAKAGPRLRRPSPDGHPLLFGVAPARQFVMFPDGGGYPRGFLDAMYPTLGVTDPTRVLHLCSGSVRVGVRVDIRPEMEPTVVADVRHLPFADESFDWIMADPPYSEGYADNMYDTLSVYPTPASVIKEAARVLRPGGRVGILHFITPASPPSLALVGIWGCTFGSNYRIRAWTVFEKAQEKLL